jgi:hypothetical protein
VVFGGNDKTTTEWVYDATTKQLSGSKIIDSLAKTSIIEIYKRDTNGKMKSIGIEKTNADGSKIQSEKVLPITKRIKFYQSKKPQKMKRLQMSLFIM